MLLNELNKKGFSYLVSDELCCSDDYKVVCHGFRISVKLNKMYDAIITQAFDKKTGKFYGDDFYTLSFWRRGSYDCYYLREKTTNNICVFKGKECIKHIENFMKEL